MPQKQKAAGTIRVGIGGWTYEPWRGTFYPPDLPHARELEYASGQLTAIEINSTYHGTQKRESFAKWRAQTPEGFVFSVKASRYCTNRRVLAESGESITRFIDSGIAELGDKLGPIVWQFAPTKTFQADDFEAFLSLLPAKAEDRKLRHVLEVRHDSFACPEYLALARKYKAATVFTDSDKFPSIADLTADFVYARMMRSSLRLKSGYAERVLDAWVQRFRTWRDGGIPDGVPLVDNGTATPGKPRDVFVFFINGEKQRAPAAAQAVLKRLSEPEQ
ncbi:DUF72 domain-containing protein [Cupriavidus sp. AU9028]|uniref:DUF72 domain-containing protein n=1 Tax=Cupriavidus sp. AU9028 TaxID=2871157 RepID=UPI001C9674C7|nr:DUF72 domain-containing protein [Cupriavidus sp. AU9028]MBY4897781.1 DUF72 domain-containing protein [Cupriavidus sp. AU9028]